MAAATHLNHFTEEEVVKLSSQFDLYQALPEDTVASIREKNDRVDHYWREIFKLLKDAAGAAGQTLLHSFTWKPVFNTVILRRPYKSGYARISGHLWEIAGLL